MNADPRPERFRLLFLLLLVAGISVAFVATVRPFLTALLLAAVATGLCHPLHLRLTGWMRGRRGLAAGATILGVLVVVVLPLLLFAGIVVGQALEVSQAARPWVAEHVADAEARRELLDRIELPGVLAPYESQIASKLGEAASAVGRFLVEELASVTTGTVGFFFLLFVMLYATFFFLRDGGALLTRALSYLPLTREEKTLLVARFVSVGRATIRGTLVIGVVQGGLAGAAFAVVGIPAAAFWGTLMAFLSVVPGLGTALVWVPAVVYLLASGQTPGGVGLAAWCVAVVGSADNVLRPRLVGRDTQMSDLLVLLSTLGGIIAFGAAGILIGPLVAALFVTVWEIYGVAFQDLLPQRPGTADAEGGEGEPG